MQAKIDNWANEPNLPELSRAWELRQRDPVQGLERLKMLAEAGSPMSMVYVGQSYHAGIGTDKDLVQAEQWFRKAADAGSVRGAYTLGRLYYHQKRYDKAKEAFEFGAVAGYAPAIAFLGRVYYFGQGQTRKDIARAKRLFEDAAAQGDIQARASLARLLIENYRTTAELLRGLCLGMRVVVARWTRGGRGEGLE